MRLFALLVMLAAFSACSATSFRVVGPYSASLSATDIRQIAAFAQKDATGYGRLKIIEAIEPDKIRAELRMEVTDDTTVGYSSYVDTRFYLLRRKGEWHPLTNRHGRIDFQHAWTIKKWPWGDFP